MHITVISGQRVTSISYWSRVTFVRWALLLVAVVPVSLAAGVALGLSSNAPAVILAAGLVVLGGLFLLRYPLLGVYILLIGATTFETFGLYFPDSLTDRIPFFHPLDSLGIPLPFTPAELLMVLTLVIVVLGRIAGRRKPLERGPVFPAVGFYTLMVLYGLAYGLGTGGELRFAVWESRAGLYIIFAYLLTFNLVEKRSQIQTLLWLFLGAVALKGLVGAFRFIVTLGGDLSRVTQLSRSNAVLSHEESVLFALLVTFTLLLILFRSDRRQLQFSLLFLAPIALAFLANQRRAGTVVLLLSILVVAAMVYALMPSKRRALVLGGIAVVLVLVPYVAVFGRSQSLVAQPARSIASLYQPSERDRGSNLYRIREGENLKSNIRLSPILGTGYGKPMEMFVYLPDLTTIFSLWSFIPHDTVLWVWMRLGFWGFVAFWFLVGRSLMEGALAARGARDPYFRAIAVLTVVMVVSWVVEGAVDMGLTDFRLTLIVGIFIGLVSRLRILDDQSSQRQGDEPRELSARAPRKSTA